MSDHTELKIHRELNIHRELKIRENLPPAEFIFRCGEPDNNWILNISVKNGIRFNRDAYPNAQPEDFAQAVIDILEKQFKIKFYKQEENENINRI